MTNSISTRKMEDSKAREVTVQAATTNGSLHDRDHRIREDHHSSIHLRDFSNADLL